MDIISLLIVAAAVFGIVLVGCAAIIPAAMELRDLAESRGDHRSVAKALAQASVTSYRSG